jgi:hypothetical protein
MTVASIRKKAVSLCFRGFDIAPSKVESLVGPQASLILEKGKPVRPGIKTLATRSVVSFQIEVESDFRLAEMIPKLVDYLGGVDHLLRVRNTVQPEFLEISFLLPVKYSKAQEGGALEAETIADLARLGASVSFGFF